MLHVVHKNDERIGPGRISPVLEILSYFSLFNYPLLPSEILKFLPYQLDAESLQNELTSLERQGYLYRFGEFCTIVNDPSLIARRRIGNERAVMLIQKAKSIGRFLHSFPFVTGIAVSGSLSKNFADEDADIDYFIITNKNRLWIARTLMHLYKKLMFLFGKQHMYCMNYFVDEESLLIKEQNIYTAVEVSTLIPIRGKGLNNFFRENRWISNWFPSFSIPTIPPRRRNNRISLKRIFEFILDSNLLDNLLMRYTERRWRKKMSLGAKNREGSKMNLQVDKHFARSNPGYFQERLLAAYAELLAQMESRQNLKKIFSSGI